MSKDAVIPPKQDYVVIKDFKTTNVISTGVSRNPVSLKPVFLKKGMVVKGELKHENGKPAFVLLGQTMVAPLDCLKRIVSQDIKSNAEGDVKKEDKPIDLKPKNTKDKYMDAVVVGGIVGFILTLLVEKKGWLNIDEENPYQNRLIGMGVGAVAGAYFMYRYGNKVETKKETKE